MLSFAAKLLALPFDILFYFFPKARERIAPEPWELMDVDRHPQI